jgi:hypothetical protein
LLDIGSRQVDRNKKGPRGPFFFVGRKFASPTMTGKMSPDHTRTRGFSKIAVRVESKLRK